MALNLHPGTRRVAIVAGAGIIGRAWSSAARETYRPYENQVEFIDFSELPMSAILQKVSNLPPKTVVIYITLLEDGDGKKFTAPESLSQISRASKAPVYSFWDLVLGHGMVGGYLSSAEEKGKEIAELGLQILNGRNPAGIPLRSESRLKYKFDWRQLKRWAISEDQLPTGSIVRFKEFSVWEQYKGRIISLIALIASLALIIVYLIHQRRIRRRAEQTLEARLNFEKMLSELSSEFTRISADKFDSKILDGLSRIGSFMNADRSYLFRFNWDKTEFRITHLWEAEGVSKDQTVRGLIVRDIFPWLYESLINNKDINISDVEELPRSEARSEYEYCRDMGIQSFIILPVQVENAPLCSIGLDSIRTKRNWSRADRDRLRLIGEIFANVVERNHSEKRVKAAELRYQTVADFTYDWEYWSNVDGSTLEYVSPSCERISGYHAQELCKHRHSFERSSCLKTKRFGMRMLSNPRRVLTLEKFNSGL